MTTSSDPAAYQINETYWNGRLALQINQSGTLLAAFTDDPSEQLFWHAGISTAEHEQAARA